MAGLRSGIVLANVLGSVFAIEKKQGFVGLASTAKATGVPAQVIDMSALLGTPTEINAANEAAVYPFKVLVNINSINDAEGAAMFKLGAVFVVTHRRDPRTRRFKALD